MVEICPLNKNHMQESHGQSIFTFLQKAGASHWQDQLPNQHSLAGHCCSHQQIHQKQRHVWATPPPQLLQLCQTPLTISAASWMGSALASSRHSAPQPPWGTNQLLHSHSWSSPDAILLQTNWEIMVIMHRMDVSEVFSGFFLTGTFLGSAVFA